MNIWKHHSRHFLFHIFTIPLTSSATKRLEIEALFRLSPKFKTKFILLNEIEFFKHISRWHLWTLFLISRVLVFF